MALGMVVVLAVSGLIAWRWWLGFAAAQRQADRDVTLAVARAAPERLAQLESRLEAVGKRLEAAEGWDRPRAR